MSFDPITLALGALSLVGTVGSAYSQYQSAKYNEKASKQEAANDILVGRQQADMQREQGKRLAASELAAAGKSGVAPTSGSPMAVFMQNARDSELRALDEEWSGKVKATQARNAAHLYSNQANSAIFTGAVGVGSTLGTLYQGMKKPASVTGGPAKP